jgi:hypothetical protein
LERKTKSVLDGIPVEDRAFPLSGAKDWKRTEAAMEVVGHCPKCGSPVYGYKYVPEGAAPPVAYSCDCRKARPAGLPMETK